MDLAPEDRKAGMFGLYYLVRDVFVSVAAFGGAFLWQVGPAANFLTACSFGLLGTIGFAIWGDDLSKEADTIFISDVTESGLRDVHKKLRN